MIERILSFMSSLKARTVENKNTTIGGGVAGIAFAALIGQLETATGCHFAEAFAGLDWAQIAGFVFAQTFGAMVTDGKKTV